MFVYSIVGELPGFIAGWNSTLSYGASGALLAIALGKYLIGILEQYSLAVPIWISHFEYPPLGIEGSLVSLFFIILCFGIIMTGTKSSINFTFYLVIVKIGFIIVVACAGAIHFNPQNLRPFFKNGITGIV